MTIPPKITLHGKPLTLRGKLIQSGDTLPKIRFITPDLKPYTLDQGNDSWTIISTVPSLDTPVCSAQAQEVEKLAAKKGNRLRWIVISEDLPFAQKRWMDESHCSHVQALSDAHSHRFAHECGLWIDELGVMARAVLLISPKGLVEEVIVVPELSEQPDYDQVLARLRQAEDS